MSLDVVILAAGKGTRMYSSITKVLHPLGGRPLLQHVVDAARRLSADKIVVVYGHGGEQVPSVFGDDHLIFVQQEPQLGTGHAVQQALPSITGQHTLVLYGDVPLIGRATLLQLLELDDDFLLRVLAHPLQPVQQVEGHFPKCCYCPGSIMRFGNWHRQIFLDSGILFRFKDS